MPKPKIGLALGAGAMRGMAHIGILEVLSREGIGIDCVAGCSIGSLIGALYCCGLAPKDMWKLAKNLRRRHWLDFVVHKAGVIQGNRTLETIRLLTRNLSFSELSIPLAVVATDLEDGTERVLDTGNVAEAVRASISVPGVFVPFEYGGRLLVDGAVLNPTPADVARRMGADIVIGVDLLANGSSAKTTKKAANIFDVIIQAIDIMEREIARRRHQDCDILIHPAVGHLSPSSFDEVDAAVEAGIAAAEAALPAIWARLNQISINSGDVT